MLERSERSPGEATAADARFDSTSARRILQRAAEEQHRLEKELTDSYSLEELEEMAAEVRISSEALHAAIRADRRDARPADARAGRRGWLAALERRMPERWSPETRNVALTGTGFVALTGLLISLWVVAPAVFWVTLLSLIVLSLLVLLGASPF